MLKDKFWDDQLSDQTDALVIKGEHYRIGSEDVKKSFKGMGGSEFTIKFKTGLIVKTTNLWHQGTIPEAYRKLLPDTADFVRKIKVQYIES